MKLNVTLAVTAVVVLAVGYGMFGCGGEGGSTSSGTQGTTGSTTGTTTSGTTGTTTAGSTGTTTSGPTTASVSVINNASAPMGFSFQSPVTVASGTQVTWNNTSAAPHGITWDTWTPAAQPAPGSDVAIFNAGATSAAWTAPTVTASTTYNYHCTVHGATMNGQIVVTP